MKPELLAEIIAIGDEMTSGQRLDTNSQWLSHQLAGLGIETGWQTTVGDDFERQTEVFRIAVSRAPVVVATGGLGPTADDLTRSVLSRISGRPLVRDAASLAHIASIFRGSGRPMPANNEVQADFPAGATILPNREGTAPGVEMLIPRPGARPCHLFCLPGVPYEMTTMWQEHVLPELLRSHAQGRIIQQRVLHCFGAGESQVESMLPDMIRRGRSPRIGITASKATISLRISALADSAENCQRMIAADEATIRQALGDLVFGVDDDTLPAVVLHSLAARNLTLAVFDHGLQGGVAESLALANPAGGPFLGGSCFPAGRSAVHGQEFAIHQPLDWDDPQTAARLAQLCRREFGSGLGVAIGPVREMAGEGQQFQLALDCSTARHTAFLKHSGHSGFRRDRSIKQVLNAVRLWLLQPAAGDSAQRRSATPG